SPTNYNNTVGIFRHVLNVAVEAGVVYSNAAAVVKRAAVRGKQIALPTIEKFNALITEMRAGHSRDSINCADFAAGLAFTRSRLIVPRRKSLQIASHITICGTCSPRAASNQAWIFRPFPAGLDTKMAGHWQ